MNNLLIVAYEEYMLKHHHPSELAVDPNYSTAPPLLAVDGSSGHIPNALLVGSATDPTTSGNHASSGGGAAGSAKKPVMAVLDFKAHRGITWCFLRSRPAGTVLGIAKTFNVLERRLAKILAMHSASSAARMKSQMVSAPIDSGDVIQGLLGCKVWPIIDAASGASDTITEKHFAEAEEGWEGIPEDDQTLEFNHTIFKLISQGAAYHYYNFTSAHMEPQFPLFLTLVPSRLPNATIKGWCEKRRGRYATSFLKENDVHADGFVSFPFEAKLELCLLAMYGRLSSDVVETLNAVIRRILMSSYSAKNMREVLSCAVAYARVKQEMANWSQATVYSV